VALFERYIGIDYSGAVTPMESLKALRVYQADALTDPHEVEPPASPRKYWTRRGIAEWLCAELSRDKPTLVGIDHGLSFPLAYFEKYGLPLDWPAFLDDFQQHWPTDDINTYVDFVRNGSCGQGSFRTGNPLWLRLTERWTAAAKSVFCFDVQGQVAKSTHAGLPWLRYLRQHCQRKIHFWPFDGWEIPEGASVVAEVYPSLWMKRFPRDDRDSDSHAAYAAAAWMKRVDQNGSLATYLNPPLEPHEREIADIEGWILGVV
jgi:hypothetical protein